MSVRSNSTSKFIPAALAALVPAVAVGLVGTAGPAHAAAKPAYVALGDSYSSGVGTRTYIDDGTSCVNSNAVSSSVWRSVASISVASAAMSSGASCTTEMYVVNSLTNLKPMVMNVAAALASPMPAAMNQARCE